MADRWIDDDAVEDWIDNDIARDATEPTGNDEATSEPHVGMIVETEKDTCAFYNDYAKFIGFGICKRFFTSFKTEQ